MKSDNNYWHVLYTVLLTDDVCPDECATSIVHVYSASICLRCCLFPDGLHFWTRDTTKTHLLYLLLKPPLLHLRSSLPHTAEHRHGLISEKSLERFRINHFSDSVYRRIMHIAGYVLSFRYDCTHFSVPSCTSFLFLHGVQCNFLLY